MARFSQVFDQDMAQITENQDFPAIARGKNLVLRRFGAIDINLGDNKSSVYVLQWGSGSTFQTIRVLSLTGDTKEIEFKKELEGDGTKHLRVSVQNSSPTSKKMAFWIEANEG